jgi:hypothetical protein
MKKMEIFTPPEKWDKHECSIFGGKNCPVKLFLAGTIDNGDSVDWQQELIDTISGIELKRPVAIYNPRRDNFPPAEYHQEIDKQINWELYHLERADLIVMNILPKSKSPISLMEIGLFAKEHKLMVFCNENFYRFDNVRVVCERYDVPLYTTNDILVIKNKVLEYANKEAEHVYNKAIREAME